MLRPTKFKYNSTHSAIVHILGAEIHAWSALIRWQQWSEFGFRTRMFALSRPMKSTILRKIDIIIRVWLLLYITRCSGTSCTRPSAPIRVDTSTSIQWGKKGTVRFTLTWPNFVVKKTRDRISHHHHHHRVPSFWMNISVNCITCETNRMIWQNFNLKQKIAYVHSRTPSMMADTVRYTMFDTLRQ